MTQGLRELQAYELAAELENILLPSLAERLRTRGQGHCMRVADLDLDLMVRICGRLRAEVPSANVVILVNGHAAAVPEDLGVTGTKLVELRNPLTDDTLRPPLMVFIPNDIRASAEDSYGVATFEDTPVGDVYTELGNRLLRELPSNIRGALATGLRLLQGSDDPWPFADPLAMARFLLTARVNGGDADAYGGALYELGLIPDFALLQEPARTPQRLARNRDCVAKLTWSPKSERGRVLDLGLTQRALRNKLGGFLAEAGLEDPRAWTRRIVLDRNLWPLAFHRWEFDDGGQEPDSLFIGDVSTDLPRIPDDTTDARLDQLVGEQILSVDTVRKFNVTFRTDPHPSRVQGLAKFTVQIISKEHGPVGLVRGKAVWKTSTQQATVSVTGLNRIAWEEGWHFARVLALTEDGDLIPLVDESGNTLAWSVDANETHAVRPHESDLFYVLPHGDVDIAPPQRAVPRDVSVQHAALGLQFTALLDGREPDIRPASVEWAQRRSRGRAVGTELLEARFQREGIIGVPISRALKIVEQKILSMADGPVCWRVPIELGTAGVSTGEIAKWPSTAPAEAFLAARARYFDAVRQGAKELVTQAADFRALRPLIVSYASAYLDLLRDLQRRAETGEPREAQRAYADLRKIVAVDSVLLTVTDHRGRLREATLVAPTHPLRALWLATWTEVGHSWLKAAKDAPREFIAATRDALLRQLAPVGFPPVLPVDTGQLLTAVDNLNPFWTLYAPTREEDPRGLIGDVCAAFGLPEAAIGGNVIDGAYLADRIYRYLLQHPYVRTLTINAFNPGHGAILADMLLHLQKRDECADLRYDIRLLVPDPQAPGVGDALVALLSPAGSVTVREADAFATPTDSHLRPKLRIAVRDTRDFRAHPEQHPAHISVLFDVFPAEDVGAARATNREAAAPIHGLVQDFQIDYNEDENTVAWTRQPRHGLAMPLPDADELTDLLASLSATLSSVAATVSTGQSGMDLRPVITLTLDSNDRALLHQVHEVSDWVLTLDRNLGIEYFDHGDKPGRPDYLIDHSPEAIGNTGHRLAITSRSVTELEAILRPVLQEYRLQAEGRHAAAILDQLRSLSGRLAMKLVSSPTQRAEAIGLALSRMYLEHQGVFENQIVIPLDAHLDLYQPLRMHAETIGNEVSFKRTDLALFDLDATARTITCRLVEVKCYNQVGDLGAFNQLKTTIAQQIAQSEQVIAYHFDPHRTPIDRPDRLVKSSELATLLEFYLNRGERYGIISTDAAEEARFLLRTLEDGYRLAFTRSALIFDFDKPGTEPAEVEAGVEYHRIGVDLIKQLLDAVAPETESSIAEGSEPQEGLAATSRDATARRRELAPSVPTLDHAAFLVPPRDRSVSWEDLRAKRALGEVASEEPPAPEAPVETASSVDDAESTPRTITTAPHRTERGPEGPSPSSQGSPGLTDISAAPEPATSAAPTATSGPHCDVLLGVTSPTPQYGLLGEALGRRIALDLNHTHTISLFGVQGGGKSYTLGAIAEMASLPINNVNQLPHPLATVIFHYSQTMDYRPEFTTMTLANSDPAQIAALRETYGAQPQALSDVLLLVPSDKIEERRREFPSITVEPLKFAAAELQASHWRFLMGAVGSQATYIRQLNRIMRSLRNDLTLDGLRDGIDSADMPDHLKALARTRLALAGEYIDDNVRLQSFVRPGRLIIVDLRDEYIEKDEALGLFVVLLQLAADAKRIEKDGSLHSFNKLVVFDEAHKYIESPDLVAGLVEVVREMRHKGTSVLVASQDPPSVPVSLIELSSQIILHKFNSPAWLKHIQKANAALGGLTPEKMANLRPGEAFVWSSKATDEAFTKGAVKVKLRARVTQHGGATKTAVEE